MDKQIEQLLELVTDGAVFLQGELPQVVKEILLFKGCEAAMWCLICCGLIGLAVWASKRIYRSEELDGDEKAIIIGIGSFITLIPVIGFFCSLTDAIKVAVAPRLYLIEFIGKLIGGES